MEKLKKSLYYITLPFPYLELLLNKIMDHAEIIPAVMDIFIVFICFFIFRGEIHDGAELLICLMFAGILLIPFLEIVAALLELAGTLVLSALLVVCHVLAEINCYLAGSCYGENYSKQSRYQSNSQSYSRDNSQNDYQKHSENDNTQEKANRNMNATDRARQLYGLYGSFTKEELKERRREMMKQAHPDAGGNTMKAQEINAAYDILMHLAN